MSRVLLRVSSLPFLSAFTFLVACPVVSGDGRPPPSFQGLGSLPGSQFGSTARAISDDGTAVTGQSDESGIGGVFVMAFRWQAGVMTPLGNLPGSGFNLSEPGGISADGSVSAGMSFSTNGTEAFRWEAGVMTGLGDLPGGEAYSHAFDTSGDGVVVVGFSRTEVADFPFRWENGVMVNLSEDFPGATPQGSATAASSDGSVVVGQVFLLGSYKPFRWTGGVMDVLEIPPGVIHGGATDVSPDGQVVVGYLFLPDLEVEAFVWEAGQMTRLGDLPGGTFNSRTTGVSSDGGVVTVVGNGTTDSGSEAFVWTPSQGMRSLRDVLELDFNLDLTGWGALLVSGVSADGLAFAGSSVNPAGKPEAWIAHLACARAGDFNNDGLSDEADIDGFIQCLLTGMGCGCGDFDGDQVVDGTDISFFLAALLQ